MQDLVDKILIEADKLKVQTISIPTLGTGRLGYSAEITAQATVNAINDFARFNSNSTLKSIQLVVYPTDKEVLKAFKNIVLSKGKMATSSNSVENIDPNKK
ncbi:poly [ADP-ribose] polymerase 14, partial [Biomphalaria glabrata]